MAERLPVLKIREAKQGFNIPILPKLCEEEMCIFPEGRRSDDYISVTYNSNLDEDLQFTEGEDIYLQIRGRASSGIFTPWLRMPTSQMSQN